MKTEFSILLFAAAASACSGSSPVAPTAAVAPAAAAAPSHKFEAVSAGYLHTMPVAGLAEFRIDNGVVFSGTGGDVETARGFNLAVYDSASRLLIQPVRNFDTWDDPYGLNARHLVEALDAIPTGAVVMIAVADESGLSVIEGCAHRNTGDTLAVETALRGLGSTLIGSYCYRNAWSLIAVKGEGRKDEQLSTAARVTSRYAP